NFSLGPVARGDIWQLAQFNFRTINRSFDLVAPGGTSEVRGDCTYGNDGITRCDDCEVDWDGPVPEMICIANMICYDNNGKPTPC
ncbi:MAG: hypothetical protein B7Z15_18960, partial [Rhizobiales bacterium 32-66-8]